MIARLSIVDRKNPTIKFIPTMNFKELGELKTYVKDLQRMSYKVRILYQGIEEWESYAIELQRQLQYEEALN